jgi:hypothetical protein
MIEIPLWWIEPTGAEYRSQRCTVATTRPFVVDSPVFFEAVEPDLYAIA